MRLYLDTSALVKRYMTEHGSRKTIELARNAELVATSLVSRTEVAAAVGKAVRLGWVSLDIGRQAYGTFLSHWPDFLKIPITEALLSRADTLAWDYALRAYDAIQLASALTWQESVGSPVTLATFDHELWEAGQKTGLAVWPAKLTR